MIKHKIKVIGLIDKLIKLNELIFKAAFIDNGNK